MYHFGRDFFTTHFFTTHLEILSLGFAESIPLWATNWTILFYLSICLCNNDYRIQRIEEVYFYKIILRSIDEQIFFSCFTVEFRVLHIGACIVQSIWLIYSRKCYCWWYWKFNKTYVFRMVKVLFMQLLYSATSK